MRRAIGRPAGRPYNGILRSCAKNGLPARPEKGILPHDFSAPRPCFRAGQGPEFDSAYNDLAKRDEGKDFCPVDKPSKG